MSRLYIPALLLPQRPASRRRPPAAARPTIRKSARHSLWCNAHCRLGALLSLFISAAALAQFPVAPLSQRPVPDVNVLGLLDKTGPNAHLWPMEAITSAGQQSELQRLGKALFWDMQVGGDGVQSCASCHYHAGADHRSIHQISPGLKSGDLDFDLNGSNNALRSSHFNAVNDQGAVVGIPVSEDRLLQLGWLPDDVDGTPGLRGAKDPLLLDVNDVISSQGIRAGTFFGLSGRRNDLVVFAPADGPFSQSFIEAAPGIPQTVRRVEPRATPSVLNAVFHLRNFWDGRADTFFNGRSPLGFRDPFAALPVWTSSGLRPEKLRIPFSSLASQAVGPVLSTFEMHYAPRRFADVGAKLAMSTPLAGQLISCSDSLLGAELDCHDEADGKRGLRGTYAERVKQIFHPRFWGDDSGNDVCLRVVGNGADLPVQVPCLLEEDGLTVLNPDADYTLLEWNFSLFFGLAVQAYEATLVSDQTIVDLLAGGVARGLVTLGQGPRRQIVETTGLSLDACIRALSGTQGQRVVDQATQLCTDHYARFIHPGAVTGSQSGIAPEPLPPGTPIGGCVDPLSCEGSPHADAARLALVNIERGLDRFFAGATGCAECHFNPEFTGATVAALTGFGALAPVDAPPGQLRREAGPALLERMDTFLGGAAVYDSGFYNIGMRPTSDDVALGASENGAPLSYAALVEAITLASQGDPIAPGLDADVIAAIAEELASGTLLLPTAPNDLTPRPFHIAVACAPGLVGNGAGDAQNNPAPQCVQSVVPGERLSRNGAFKTPGLRNLAFTGPYFHHGAKRDLRQVIESYKTAGHFPLLNGHNLDAGMREFQLGEADEAALVELLETGLTDWRVAFETDKFDHPELCLPHGHDENTGVTRLVSVPAVGREGGAAPLQTFAEQLDGVTERAHSLRDPCTIPSLNPDGL